MRKLRILLADDHAMMREGLVALINSEPDMEVVGEASDGEEVLARAVTAEPDVVLMDVSMPGLDGIRATRRLKAERPGVCVLALTAYDNDVYVRQSLNAGASGYVLKKAAANDLIKAIRAVAVGGKYLDPDVARRMEEGQTGAVKLRGEFKRGTLTDREREVLVLVARGFTNKEISGELGISVKTVEVHKGNFMSKLELKNRADVVRYALSLGWLERS